MSRSKGSSQPDVPERGDWPVPEGVPIRETADGGHAVLLSDMVRASPLPQRKPLSDDEVRQLLRECVTVIGPGETLVLRMGREWTPSQMREVQDMLDSVIQWRELPFGAIAVPGDDLGVVTHEHEWKRCPNCPHPGQPCACSGMPCCDQERAEIVAEAERAGD